MLRNADISRASEARTAAGTAAQHADQIGMYLTDEVFLYRLHDVLITGAGEMAELEDCYRLDVVRVPVHQVRARRLRVVTPAARAQNCGAASSAAGE